MPDPQPAAKRFDALIVLFAVGLQSANADTGSISLTIFKGGWIIGGSAGGGTLVFHGRRG